MLGHWGFGDCLELGVGGGMCQGLLTWEESKTHLAIFAVASQPLFLGNDVRPGVMQQRLLDILLNPDMLQEGQSTTHASICSLGQNLLCRPESVLSTRYSIMTVNSHIVLPRICMKYQNILK